MIMIDGVFTNTKNHSKFMCDSGQHVSWPRMADDSIIRTTLHTLDFRYYETVREFLIMRQRLIFIILIDDE